MRALLPEPAESVDLHEFYGRDWNADGGLRVNFVSSVDGAATANGLSRGLQTPGDNKVFAALRDLSDVIVVGAGTARDEGYRPSKPSAARREKRAEHGYPAVPAIAIVSRSLDLDPTAELFTGAEAKTIVLTVASADEGVRDALTLVADVVICGEDEVDLPYALEALRERGHRRLLCEGGPHLFTDLAAAGLADELCLSLSPLLVGPHSRAITAGVAWEGDPRGMRLAGLLEEDGALFARYRVS
jgi:riboflavin biosynthesis pyrimidine reductase